MKKKILALLLAAAATVSLLSGCGADSGVMDTANANAVAGGNSDLPVITWKMGSTWGAGNVHFTVDQRFSEILSQLTGGRFTVTNYSEGELCSASQLFDYVSQGTIQCGGDWGGYWSARTPRSSCCPPLWTTSPRWTTTPGFIRPAVWTATRKCTASTT